MARLTQMAWGKHDDESGGLRGRFGKWLLKQALRLIPVEDLRSFHWYPHGYSADDEDKYHVVLSDNPVQYWGNFEDDTVTVHGVFHDEDGLLGLFWPWTEAQSAASLLSQNYDDYHFREHAHNVEEGRIQIVEDRIDGIEPNLSVEKVPLHRVLDYDEWPEDASLISSDTVRTFEEVREAEGLSDTGENTEVDND